MIWLFVGYDTSMKLFLFYHKGSTKKLTTPNAKFDELFNSVNYCPWNLLHFIKIIVKSLVTLTLMLSLQRSLLEYFLSLSLLSVICIVNASNMDLPFIADVALNSLG